MIKRTMIMTVLLGTSALCGSTHASAQATAGPPAASSPATDAPAPGEIIVTANKRAENVQKVPISIAVLTGATLKASGVSNATQLQISTTNVQVSVLNTKPLFYIRGMGSASLTPGSESPTGLYLDGIYLPESSAADESFLDIERVEVLKGPQGTLYGRNTTAGAINFITRDPSAKRTVEGQLTLGTWGTQQLQTYVSTGPGRLSASIAAGINRHDAFLKNLAAGPDFNNRKEWGIRGKVKFEATDRWTATLSADYDHRNDFSGNGFIQIYDKPTAADPALGGHYTTIKDPRHTYADFPSTGDQFTNYGVALTIKGELPFADFVSLSGYRNTREWSAPDADASDLPLTNFVALNRLHNWSQEFQLVSNQKTSPLEWIVGLYTFHSTGGLAPVAVYNQGNPGSQMGNGRAGLIDSADLVLNGVGSSDAYAAYAQASYRIFEGFKLTGGLRYSDEKRSLDKLTVNIPGGSAPLEQPQHQWFHALDPKVGLEYSFGRQLLYANFSKGFRSGSYNILSPGDVGPVKPETVTAWEIGGKHTLMQGLQFNWAAFYDKYKDLQVSRELNNGQGSLFSTQNAASATIKGAEADLVLTSIRHLTLDLGVGYLHARYGSFPNAAAYVPTDPNGPLHGYGVQVGSIDASGLPLARAPNWSTSAQANYTIPIGDGHLDLNGVLYYTTKYYLDTPSKILVHGYAIANLRAEYFLPGNNISVGVFANNVTNKVYIASASTNAFGFIGQPNDPRIIGATVSLKY